jgi:hypothetical protein
MGARMKPSSAFLGSSIERPAASLSAVRSGLACAALALATVASFPGTSLADEGGISFWVPGQFGSLAAIPQVPGWSLAAVNYYTPVTAGGSVAAAREVTIGRFNPTINVNLNANLNGHAELVFINPSYVFANQILGGQLTVGMAGVGGVNNAEINGTLTASAGGITATRQGSISDTLTAIGDLYPLASLRWNSGVNNWMVYGTGDIPIGNYNPSSLVNLGIGHGAADGGVGYTYFDPKAGHEFSVVTGLTYNLLNPSTDYQNGIDWHLDWGASQFLTKQLLVGAVGYVYQQVTPDSGCNPVLCPFESRVIGIGPQVGYIFPAGNLQGYVNLKAYWEFDAQDRPSGWNAWVTLSFSPSAAASAPPPMITK